MRATFCWVHRSRHGCFRLPIVRRLAALLLLSDANFAHTMAARDRGETDAGILFGSGLTMSIVWIDSTAVGAYAGLLLGDLSRFSFDAVMVAYFRAPLVGWWKGLRTNFHSLPPRQLPLLAPISAAGMAYYCRRNCMWSRGSVAAWLTWLPQSAPSFSWRSSPLKRVSGVWIMSYVTITPRVEVFCNTFRYLLTSIVAATAFPQGHVFGVEGVQLPL